MAFSSRDGFADDFAHLATRPARRQSGGSSIDARSEGAAHIPSVAVVGEADVSVAKTGRALLKQGDGWGGVGVGRRADPFLRQGPG
jgi:hypothetical protein